MAERARCANLVQALLDSIPVPTALSLVITAEKMFLPGPVDEETAAERRRCIQIVDAAAVQDFASKPAVWALAAIRDGVDVIPGRGIAATGAVRPGSTGTPGVESGLAQLEDLPMPIEPDAVSLVETPLTVDVVADEVFLDGHPQVNVALSRDAAIETGIKLVNAGVGIDPDKPV